MSLRLLLGLLAPGPPDQQNDSQSSEIEIRPQNKDIYATDVKISDFQNAAKFHIGMLSISLIIGLALGGFIIWWMEKKPFLTYVINLLIALVCRTFFSILFDGVILLGSGSVPGGNALMAFEQISINLVLAFWLSLTIYLHARVQRNFKSEPTLNLYRYGVPGAAAFFAFIWIFLLHSEAPSYLWWLVLSPFTQWIVNSFNLLCLLVQLALVGDIARIMMKTSLDNDSISLFRKAAILMGVLVFIFWLQFGLFIGRLPLRNSMSYTYFFYFVDGTQCASVCVILYFFSNWVQMFLNSDSRQMSEVSLNSTVSSPELLAGSGGRGIVTLDSVFMTNESGKWKKSEEDGDVVYSNVVDPQRWEKILDLYKRLNKVPNQQGTVVEGDEFPVCPLRTDGKMSKRTQRSISEESRKRMSSEDRCPLKNDKICDQGQKKNAFYSSKYLILDSKWDIPKYLETRPSVSSMSGRSISKESRMSKDYSPGISSVKTEDLVEKWLSDNSKNMSKKDSLTERTEEPFLWNKKPSEVDVSKGKPVLDVAVVGQDRAQSTENRGSAAQKIFSTIDSVFRFPFSGNDVRKNSAEKDEQKATGQHLSSKTSTETSGTIKPLEIERKPAESLSQSNDLLMDKIPSLATDKNDKPGEVPVLELQSKITIPLPPKNKKFGEGTHVSNAQIEEQKGYEPKQPDAKEPEAKDTYLNQYLSNSELQERRMSREKRESEQRGQASKSIFGFPEKISSMVGYFVNGRGSLLGLRTDPKLSNTENLKADIVPRSESEGPLVRQSGKTPNWILSTLEPPHTTTTAPSRAVTEKNFQFVEQTLKPTAAPSEAVTEKNFQFEEQKLKPTAAPSKAISENEHFPMRKISISSGSEFSIERPYEEQPRQELGISVEMSKSINNLRLFGTEERRTSSSSDSSSPSSSGSFSIEQYYQGLSNTKQKIEKKNQRTLK